jgi:phage-related minor tail protein
MSNDIDKATNKFIAQTGSSKDSAKEFEDAMTSIYNGNYGESFEDISEAMATVKTAMGDIGTDELEKLTTDALILRDTFDMDVNESIRAVNSLMDQFGITADEAYSLIAQGAQNGLNQNGDLLDVVNEYALQFKDAGFSADDMFNVLANGTETGTWSVDKLGDAVKEFNIRASDGTVTKALKENAEAFGMTYNEANDLAWQVSQGNVGAYQELADKLRDVDNDTQRYQLGVAMFGTMWEDLGEETVLALLDTQGEISKTTDALDEINSVQYDDLGSALEGIGRNLETSLAEPIKNNVMPAINEFVEDVDWESVGQTIGEVFAVVVEGAIALVNGIKEVVQWMNEHKAIMAAVAAVVGILTTAITAYNVVNGIKAAMDAAQVTTVWALVAAHWAQVTAAMAAIAPYVLIVAAIAAVIAIIVLCVMYWDEIVAAVKKAWEKIKEVLAQWGEWIDTNVIQPVVKFFSDLWNSVKTAALNAWNGIKSTWSAVKAWFNSTVVQPVKNFFSNMWTSVKTAASNAWSGIKNTWSAVKNWYNTTVVQPVRNFFSNMWSGIKNAGSNAWSGIKNVWSGVSGFFSGIVGKVKTVFSKVKDHILSPYRNAINAVKNLFSKLKLAFPNIKLPHFGISPKGWKIGDLLKGSIPKLSIDWYKDGGIMMKPTVFGVNGNSIMAGGEAGPEAILPIDRLEGYIAGAIERHMNVVNLQSLADAIEELANRPIAVNINGRQFALATASDGDTVNGLRSNFKSRGLAIE